MKVHVFYWGWIANDHKSFTKGGVQTYLYNLSKIFGEEGYEFHYYRASNINNEVIIDSVHVHEVKLEIKNHDIIKPVFDYYKDHIDKQHDIVLFADDFCSTEARSYNSISIQHGIFWDIPAYKYYWRWRYFIYFIEKCRKAWNRMIHTRYVKQMVCVDYNFVNWYRAVFPYTLTNMRVIPNFSYISEPVDKPSDCINIIFARRFQTYRGTRIFTESILKILNEYDNVKVTIAGWGADKEWMLERLGDNEKVIFTEYDSTESLEIHKDKHIAVVPTTGSEGTSLSLLEAMSAQCAVIASDVGGMTNIVIDGHNGLLVPAGDIDKLYNAIKKLIDDKNERERLAMNGYVTVKEGFSYEKWKNSWIEIIRNIKK